MEDRNDKLFRIRQLIIFSILMGGVLASVIALYDIAKPFIENPGGLNITLILAIILIVTAYVMAIKTGIPPSPPKTREIIPGVNPPDPPEQRINPVKRGNLPSQPKAAVKSGIPPSPRKTNG